MRDRLCFSGLQIHAVRQAAEARVGAQQLAAA